MTKNSRLTTQIAFAVLLLSVSFSSFAQNNGTHENFAIKIQSNPDILSVKKIKSQKPLTMQDRADGVRGIVDAFLVTKGIQGIQSLIDNRKKKYSADYSFAIKDESFYDQISTLGPFDPVGIRFQGFKIARIVTHEDGSNDTAFVAKFSIDTSDERINEIMNNGVFRLKLDSFSLKTARVQLLSNDKRLNMDLEINFLASFISDNGQINSDVSVGKFIYTIRNAPLDPNDPTFNDFYKNLPKRNPYCLGKSFLVPRSAGYYKNEATQTIEKCYGEGLFSIKVAVKESSKNKFIDKVIVYSSDDILTVGNAALQKKYGSAPASPAKKTTTKPAN